MHCKSAVLTILAWGLVAANNTMAETTDSPAIPPGPNRIMLKPNECAATVRGAPPSHWFCAENLELNEKRAEIARLKRQLNEAQAENIRLLADTEAAKEELLETRSELANARETGQALRNQMESRQHELEQGIAQLRQQLQAQDEQLNAVSAERNDNLARLETAMQRLDTQQAVQEKMRQACDRERSQLEQRLADAEQKLADTRATAADAQKRLTGDLDAKQTTITDLEQKLQSLRGKIGAAEEQNSTTVSQLITLRQQLDTERAEARRLLLVSQEEKSRLDKQLADAVSSSQAVEEGLNRCKEEAATVASHQERLSSQVTLYRQLLGDADRDGIVDPRDLCPGTTEDQTADSTGCAGDEEIVLQGVTFAFDSAELSRASLLALEALAAKMKNHPDLLFEIAGHTDDRGDAEFNARISAKRAEAVKDYLVAKGVPEDSLSTKGYGQERPIADNATAAGRALNRRVSLMRRDTKP